jgi:hypothetical protein
MSGFARTACASEVKRASAIDWPRTAWLSALLDSDHTWISGATGRSVQLHDAIHVDGGLCMSELSERDNEGVRHERAIRSLRDRTGAPLPEVRRLFAQEFSRLELGAKVRSYLSVLTVSNVRAMLRRRGA